MPSPRERRVVAERLEYQRGTLGLLVTTKFEMLASLQRQLCLRLARCALQSQHNFLRSLCLFVENRFSLTTVTGLFAIITTLSLREQRRLSGLVLCDFVLGVLSAVLALAVGASGFGYVDHLGDYLSVVEELAGGVLGGFCADMLAEMGRARDCGKQGPCILFDIVEDA